MKKPSKKALLSAAVAGILGATLSAGPSQAKEKAAKKAPAMEHCYGINKCAGHGKCAGEGHACAGKNSCQGQGYLDLPKDTCMEIQGGSLTPAKKG